MIIEFTNNGWEDFEYWIETDKDVVNKIKDLLKSIRNIPFRGIGKPEPLKYGQDRLLLPALAFKN